MAFLIVDERFGVPIYVFLETDPRGTDDFPPLRVCEVQFEQLAAGVRPGTQGAGVGQHPMSSMAFREFISDSAVAAAGYGLIEPRFVGNNWQQYLSGFCPGGNRSGKSRSAKSVPARAS